MSRLHFSLALAGMLAIGGMSGFEAQADTPALTTPGPRVAAAAYRQGEVIVKLRPQTRANVRRMANGGVSATGSNGLSELMTKYGVSDAEQLMPLSGSTVARRNAPAFNKAAAPVDGDMSKLYCLQFDASQNVDAFVDELGKLAEVEFAEPNYIVYATAFADATVFGSEPMFGTQWGIPAIGLDKLWKVPVTASRRSVIAILDTGVDIEHPDLKDNIWTNTAELDGSADADDDGNGFADDIHGYDFVNQTGRMRDNNGHGTHCAGIAGAMGNNGIGITGANPDALIMPVTVMQSDGTGDVATIIKGIDYAAANGADVISMSFGGYAHSIAEEQALAKAYQKAVLVAAAGNDNLCIYPHLCPVNNKVGATMFPAGYSFVLGVQASSQSGSLASFSNFDEDGPITSTFSDLYNYELTAPGQSIISTFPGGLYRSLNGTSMACPLVAGAISRLLSVKEYTSKEELFGDLIYTSKGNIDIYGAYNITEADRQPTLSLVTYRIDDTESGDGDKRPDAGETIYIYPTLRNQWGNARNITFTIKLAANEDPAIAEFVDADAVHTLPNLSSYATAETQTPFAVKISPDCVDGRRICFVLTATCDNITAPLEQEFVLSVENGVEIGGVLREDMTLTPDKNYIVTSLLGVPAGRTLTILPGTTIKFKDGTGLSVADGGKVIANGEPGKMITFTKADHDQGVINAPLNFNNFSEPLNYVIISDLTIANTAFGVQKGYLKNSIISNFDGYYTLFDSKLEKSNIFNNTNIQQFRAILKDCNYTNNRFLYYITGNECIELRDASNSNVLNNQFVVDHYKWILSGAYYSRTPEFYTPEQPNYLGSARQDIVQPTVLDIKNPLSSSFGEYDLSNMLTRPSAEAHGIVWKVVVNGYDAQDEYEQLPPLGVGRHKFEVYFNRPMNKEKTPMIAMGVRAPYTQTAIGEDGAWNETGDVYTAYLTISGRDNYDGVNTIYVADAEDNEFFPIPVESYRFRVNVQSAGSMSAGFTAEPGLGKVTLTWENPEENVSDLLGYNLYRYTVDDTKAVSDTIRINDTLLDKEEFTDFDVTPGTTYCYYYKVMTTALTENSPSKVVATTPLTSVKGDANGTMAVDVADIVTEVGYMLGQNPQPFIFDAADVNSDTAIDVLDVVGTVNIITGTPAPAAAVASVATYYVENGVLYVNAPVALGGVQIGLTGIGENTITPLEALNGFETMGARGKADDYTFLAFSLSGRKLDAGINALLNVGDSELSSIILSDAHGRNIPAVAGNPSGVTDITADNSRGAWPNPFTTEVNVPFEIGVAGNHNVTITLTSLTGMTVASHNGVYSAGSHSVQLATGHLEAGFYLLNVTVDGVQKTTQKVIKL